MPLDTWETNSAFEIGTLALRPSHHVSAIAHITNRSMTPAAGPSHPLAPKRPMTEGVQLLALPFLLIPERRARSKALFGTSDSCTARRHPWGCHAVEGRCCSVSESILRPRTPHNPSALCDSPRPGSRKCHNKSHRHHCASETCTNG